MFRLCHATRSPSAGDGASSFVLDGQRVEQRNVTLGLGDDDKVQAMDGVEPGERVVVRGLETLTDGTRVRIVDAS